MQEANPTKNQPYNTPTNPSFSLQEPQTSQNRTTLIRNKGFCQ